MKHNHQRGFVDPGSFRDHSCEWRTILPQSGTAPRSFHIENDFTNGKRGHARALHGMKSALRQAFRRDAKIVIMEQWREENEEGPENVG